MRRAARGGIAGLAATLVWMAAPAPDRSDQGPSMRYELPDEAEVRAMIALPGPGDERALESIVARSLFVPSRSPPERRAPKRQEPTPERERTVPPPRFERDRYVLRGIIALESGDGVAIVQPRDSEAVRYVRAGEKIGQWEVEAVTDAALALVTDHQGKLVRDRIESREPVPGVGIVIGGRR